MNRWRNFRNSLLGFPTAWALAWIVCGATPALGLTISLETSAVEIRKGETVDVDVVIAGLGSGGTPSLGSFEFDVGFHGGVLGGVTGSIQFGAGLGSPTCAFPPTSGCQVIVDSSILVGAIELAAAARDLPAIESSQPDSFVLASFSLIGLGPGTTALTFARLALGDTQGSPLSATANTAPITVVGVPEANGAFLIALALLGALRSGAFSRSTR